MKQLIKRIKNYFISKDMWEAKMKDPIIPRKPSPSEIEKLKRRGVI